MIERAVRRLKEHFTDVVTQPPCPDVSDLEDEEPITVPHGLREFLTRYDGIEVGTEDPVNGELFGSDRMMSWQGDLLSASPPTSLFLPLHGDGCGNYYVTLCDGPAHGGVFFYDHEPDALTVAAASDVPHFIAMWADHLIATHRSNGERSAVELLPCHDLDWLRANDPALLMLMRRARPLAYCNLASDEDHPVR